MADEQQEKIDAITAVGDAISSTAKIILEGVGENPSEELADAAIVAAGTGFSACLAVLIDMMMRSVCDELTAEDAGKLTSTMIGAAIRKTVDDMLEEGSPNEYAKEALKTFSDSVASICPDNVLEELESEDEDPA